MRSVFLFTTVFLLATSLQGQRGNPTAPVSIPRAATPPASKAPQSVLKPEVTVRNFEEWLVQTATTNRNSLKILQYGVAEAEAKQKVAKKRWANGVTLNAGGLITDAIYIVDNSLQLPGYNFGVGLSLGPILQQRATNKEYKAGTDIANAKLNEDIMVLRMQVLSAYRDYVLSIEIFGIRLQALDVASTNRALLNELFSANRAEFTELNQAEEAYFRALLSKQEAESNIKLAQYQLEATTGEKWDVIERMRNQMVKN